ncbi:MAG: zinc-ribbon domain-containing protein [Clostridia bacterium]|nr:zinc-ribbon domain-containing protein [Clostridia bacterium]
MVLCNKCGREIDDGVNFCPYCGYGVQDNLNEAVKNEVEEKQIPPTPPEKDKGFENKRVNDIIDKFNNTADVTDEFELDDIVNNKIFAIFAYLGPLVLITIFGAPSSKYARFHASQGINLLVCEVIYSMAYAVLVGVFMTISPSLGHIVSSILVIVNIGFLLFSIIGIIDVIKGKAKELPLIGKLLILK